MTCDLWIPAVLIEEIIFPKQLLSYHVKWIPCNHGIVGPQVADEQPPAMEGS
jgi:hypothetical protein